MSRPIKPTPILFGKDAKRFIKEMNDNKDKIISKEDYFKIKSSANNLKNIIV